MSQQAEEIAAAAAAAGVVPEAPTPRAPRRVQVAEDAARSRMAWS